MKNLGFTDEVSGLRVILSETEAGTISIKCTMNGFKVNMEAYELTETFLVGLQRLIGEFLG